MRISVFGLGYVGTISAVCLARAGHEVIGVDTDEEKVERIAAGRPPVHETGLAPLLEEVVHLQRFKATGDGRRAVLDSEVSLVAVGTPSGIQGDVDLGAVERVAETIGSALQEKTEYHLLVVRSTVPPGTTEGLATVLERRTGKRAGAEFGVCMNPEFLREGSALADFYSPPYTVIGEYDAGSGERLKKIYESIAGLEGEIRRVDLRTAEMLKYANNSLHAVKVSFANEMARLCDCNGVDATTLMDLVSADRKLNLSPYYLRPGFAFGGSCLPKDTRAAIGMGRRAGMDLPLLEAAITSNDAHIQQAAVRISRYGMRRIGILGITFKADTDDLRESPVLRLVEILGRGGCEISVFDPRIASGKGLLGANRELLDNLVSSGRVLLLGGVEELINGADLVVVGVGAGETVERLSALVHEEQALFDLTGVLKGRRNLRCRYESLI